jgi:DNA-binding GntR family transcriptional regulator
MPSARRAPFRQSLADSVYEELLARLFDDSLGADAPLNIDALSRELDVSQTPIREALARLESTGLVIRTALRGYRVAPMLTPKELADLMDARHVLEPQLALRAASRSDPAFVAELQQTIDDLAVAPTGPSFAEYQTYWKADERFHDLIAHRADNVFLYRAFQSLGGQAQRFRLFGGLGVSDADAAIAEHQTILDAFRTADPDAVEAAMDAHVLNVRARAASDA